MYLSIQPTPTLIVALFLALTFQLAAQDHSCTLSPPAEVMIFESNNNYSISWEPNDAAIAYEVVVIDTQLDEVLYQEVTQTPAVEIDNVQFSEHSSVGIAAICQNQENGGLGYFVIETNSTIIVQDIVMQMQGEENPRTLECDMEKNVIQSTAFSGGISSGFSIIPPFNTMGAYQVEGAIIDVTLYNQTVGSTFAKATMLGLSNNTVINAASQTNVTSTGTVYEFLSPASQNFFDFSTPVTGEFEFFVNTVVPSGSTYQLVVEQRNCFNVNKIHRRNKTAPLMAAPGDQYSVRNTSQKATTSTALRLYPNPSTHYIQFSRSAEQITIRNHYGQVVYQASQLPAQALISTTNLSSGVYYFEATTVTGETEVIRFVKS